MNKKIAVVFSMIFANFSANLTAWAAPSIPKELLVNSLIYCTTSSGFSFNPQKSDVSANMNVVTEQIYDKLVEFNPHKNRLEPALAERYSISDDGMEITLYLRKNVSFHTTDWFTPTRKFNAEDVVFSLNRMIGANTGLPEISPTSSKGILHHRRQSYIYQKAASQIYFPYFESVDLHNKIAKVSAPSSYVVKIELTKPDSSIMANLASQYAVILSKEYALQLNADENLVQLDLLPIGTGVYQLKGYENNRVRLKPHPDYWGKKAHIQNMIINFSTEATGRMAKFLNNECHVVAFPEPSQLSILKNDRLISSQGANLAYLAFNMQREIGHNLALRRKIARSINRQRIADRLFYGQAEVADNVLPTALWKKKNIGSYPYIGNSTPIIQDDEEKSKNSEKNNRLMLWVIDEKRVYNPHPIKMAEMIRSDLAAQQIELDIRLVSRAYLVQQLENRTADYDLILGGWLANNLDPGHFLEAMLSCKSADTVTNLSNWCNEDFDFWLQTARLSEDSASTNLLYEFAQKLLEEQLPLLPLVNANRILVVNNAIQNADISPFGQVKLSELRLEKDKEKGK